MRVASAKNKGRRLQQQVRDSLLEGQTTLEPDDIRSTSMGMTGEDIQMSPAARRIYPYAIECKCVEKLNIWDAIAQARAYAGKHIPAVAFSKNHEEIWVAIPMSQFTKLHKGTKDEL